MLLKVGFVASRDAAVVRAKVRVQALCAFQGSHGNLHDATARRAGGHKAADRVPLTRTLRYCEYGAPGHVIDCLTEEY